MKTTKLVVGILMIVLSVYIVFQSMLAGFGDALVNNGGTSEGSGLIFAILFLASGIVYIVNKSKTSLKSDIACLVMLLIAWLIGVTMSGIYGDLIVWGWLAFIIGVGFFVWHLISNKKNPVAAESDIKTSEQDSKVVKPWYKKWWVWVLAVVALFFVIAIGGSYSSSEDSSKTSTEKVSGHTTTDSEKGSSTATKKLTVDYTDYTISNSKTFSTNYTDTTWSAANVTVSKVVLYTLEKPTKYKSANDGTFTAAGFVKMYFSIKANKDIHIYPTQGTYIFNSSEQHQSDSMENWDGDISNGVTKTGTVTVPIEDASSLKTIRVKFDSNYDTDNYDDTNSNHSYDFTLNLQ